MIPWWARKALKAVSPAVRPSGFYRPLEDHDNKEELDSPAMGLHGDNIRGAAKDNLFPKSIYGFIFLNIGFFLLSSSLFLYSLPPTNALYEDRIQMRSKNYILKQVSMKCTCDETVPTGSAPILDESSIRIASKRMDATLVQPKPPVVYREEPSYEVDKAWQELYDTRPVPLSRSQVLAMGKDPEQSVQVPVEWGHGNETYFGSVDVFHQIHCLDTLRREAHFEHYYGKHWPGGYNDTDEFHKLHLSHCIYYLLQNIMCQANTDIFQYRPPVQRLSYSAVKDWQSKNALDEEEFVKLKRPEGYAYRKMSHKFKEIHGWEFGPDEENWEWDDDGDIA
ncbi:hypothetical protein LSUE1_G009820 [Lachnellula suecica]|uniref:Uncharacterized protein n=1 Tax=Lachnellula suecica TaxID=602035 RepID=A0A8T9BWX5_9HELO|nr:hypothetical protein LSUE1_G009820 [Lachnellula suecica]